MKGKRVAITLGLLGLTACTPREIQAWVAWHDQDPAAAEAFAAQLPPQPKYTNNHAARWEQIAWCESGRQWHLRATNRTGTYGGGLMIRDNVWVHYGGREFAGTADQASKEQQIHVAERILADVGWGAWDCA